MAILSKIRDRSMILILIVGMALFAFVLDPSSIQNFFSASKVDSVGQVNGEDIGREEFMQQVEAYRSQSNGRVSQMQAVNYVWNNMLSEKVFESQLEKAGIVVGEKDIWEAMVALPDIQNAPLFKNEANLFDEEKLKEYVANMRDEATSEDNNQQWLNWIATEKSIKQNLERQAYTSLVSAGLGSSLEEGKRIYEFENTKIDAKYVYVPYTSVPDSLVTVSKEEINKYVKNHPKRFKPEATRSLQYVKFEIVPSKEDDAEMKKKVQDLINDTEKSNYSENIVGLKNSTNYEEFFSEHKSDVVLDNGYKFENQLPADISAEIMNTEIGNVFGPYKNNGYYKISKVVEVMQLPDSVKSNHIIIPYAGSTRSTSTKTKEEAKKTADSVYVLVRNNKTKFAEIADEINSDGTKGKGGDLGWTRKDQAFSNSFDKDFADYIYNNKPGSIDVVETAFGYHIIRIDEQTAAKKAVRLVTFGRLVDASEETENDIFELAESLAARLSEGKKIADLAEENNYNVQSALNLKVLEENIPGLNTQRQMVTWSFEKSRELGDFKRFDIDIAGKRGYAVAVLNGITKEDDVALTSIITSDVKTELMNRKKSKMIGKEINGTTLEEVAKSKNTTVRATSSVTLASPLLSGVGNEPTVVGAMSTLKLEEISKLIEGEKGVFIVKVTKREQPVALENYESYRKKLLTQLKGRSFQMYKVLQDKAEVKDNRKNFF